MNEHDEDIIELIRAANPFPSVEDVPARTYDLDAFIESVMTGARAASPDVVRELNEQRRRRSRRRGGLIIAGAAILGTTSAAAAYVVTRDQPSEPAALVSCHADERFPGAALALEPSADDPIARCTEAWREGRLPNPDEPSAPRAEAPALIACTGPGLGVNVFPSSDPELCQRLGMVTAEVRLDDDGQAVVELQDRLIAATYPDCVSSEDAAAEAQRTIDDLGVDGWTIEVIPPERDSQACARVAVDAETRTVRLVPTDPIPSPATAKPSTAEASTSESAS